MLDNLGPFRSWFIVGHLSRKPTRRGDQKIGRHPNNEKLVCLILVRGHFATLVSKELKLDL